MFLNSYYSEIWDATRIGLLSYNGKTFHLIELVGSGKVKKSIQMV